MLNIVLSMDENNLDGLFATLNSIIINTKHIRDIKFNILAYDNGDMIKSLMTTFGSDINYELKEFKFYTKEITFLKKTMCVVHSNNYIMNIMNFARFYLPFIFPDIEYALYLDTDTIIQTDIINIMNNIDLPKKLNELIIASPLNRKLSTMNFDPIFKMDCNNLGFNTGVLLINFNYWRKNNVTKQCEDIMIMHKNAHDAIPSKTLFTLGTQPILNIIFYQKCLNLNKKWNFTGLGSKIYDLEKLNRQYILHWTGICKPWNNDGLNKSSWIRYKIIRCLQNQHQKHSC